MIPATRDEQRRLLQLQRVDTTIRQLEHRRTNLDEQKALDDNADTLRRVAAEYSSASEELDGLQRRQKHLEEDIGQVEGRRRSEEGRMYSGLINSDRELEALRGEISALRSRKNELEDQLLEVMERTEELDSLVATLRLRHSELTAAVERLTAARDAAAVGIDAELETARVRRVAATEGMSPEVVTVYDDLRPRKGGIAVAALEGRTCGGCRLDLTATEMEEAKERSARGLTRCEQCDRILVLA
ncbi:MAG: zinc ribbon domain-containing protein [Egibacteraceae bacterium]